MQNLLLLRLFENVLITNGIWILLLFAAKSGENTHSQLSLFFGPDQGQNRDSQLSLFLGPEWVQNSGDANNVSDVSDASNANKASHDGNQSARILTGCA